MSRFMQWAACAAFATIVSNETAFAQAACDRDCLRSTLDRYLDAVVAHDPGKAPLVVGFRQTENAINVAPGRGVWNSVTALGKVQRRYFDPVSGQAGYYGTVMEGAETAVVTVRLRVENRQLTEAEWYIARANDPGLRGPREPGGPPANLHNPEYLEQHPPPQRVVPRNERVDRAASFQAGRQISNRVNQRDSSGFPLTQQLGVAHQSRQHRLRAGCNVRAPLDHMKFPGRVSSQIHEHRGRKERREIRAGDDQSFVISWRERARS